MQLFVGVGGVCGAWFFGMKKGLRNSEGLCIHDGGASDYLFEPHYSRKWT